MENSEISRPNFILLKIVDGMGPIYKVTISRDTLEVLEEIEISGIPEGWSVQDFYDLLDEGKRFFSQETSNQMNLSFNNSSQ